MEQIANIETAVISALLHDPNLFVTAEQYHLTEETFTSDRKRHLFRLIMDTIKETGNCDLVTLAAKEPTTPDFDIELAETYSAIVTTVSFPTWAAELKDREVKRDIAAACAAATRDTQDPALHSKDIAATLAGATETARITGGGKEPPTIEEAAEAIKREIREGRAPIIPLFPSNTEAARKIRLHPGEMFVLGARTGSGKTAFCAAAALEQLKAGWNVAYFCTESSTTAIMKRFAAALSGIPHYLPTRGPAEIEAFSAALDEIVNKYGTRLHIIGNDAGAITPGVVRQQLRKIESEGAAQVVYIDFLQNMKPDKPGRSQLEEINATIQSLHDMLCENGIAGIIVSQFNRAGQAAAANGKCSEKPNLTWLKETSALEQLADTVCFLHSQKEFENKTLLYSEKTRNSPRFEMILQWDGVKYRSLDPATNQY